jgi:hypothetical protein
MQRKGRKALRRWQEPGNSIHEEYRKARNTYSEAIKRAKEECWSTWLANIDESSMWKASSFMSTSPTDTSRARVPTLSETNEQGEKVEARTSAEKTKLFATEFFPKPPGHLQIDEDEQEYDAPKFEFEPITDDHITSTIKKLKPFKAPDTGEFSNSILINCADVIVPRLGVLYHAVNALGYWPEKWAYLGTIVLRKPGKGDYTKPNSHRPISLIKKFAMLYSKCLSKDLIHQAETYKMLSPTQFGFRPGRTTTDALQYIVTRTKNAWRQGKSVALLMLDIKAAFPHIVVSRLVHIMWKKGVPKQYTDWITRRFKGRKTRLRFDDYESEEITIDNRLDQGDPFSTIGMVFYIDELLTDVPDRTDKEEAIGFADGTTFQVIADDDEEAAGKVESIMAQAGGALDWGLNANCHFGIAKTVFMVLSRKREPNPDGRAKTRPITRPEIMVDGLRIQPSRSARLLGIIIDQELRFQEHAAHALVKGQEYMRQFNRLARNSKGVWHKYMRRFYLSIAVPRMLYAADIWLAPPVPNKQGSNGHIAKLATVQRQAALGITGAMRTTATDIVNAHANLPPFEIVIHQLLHRATLRMATLLS